jgi:glycerol kinase
VTILVIDIGTTGLRTALIDGSGTIIASVYRHCAPTSPAPGLVEFDASTMWQTTLEACRQVLSESPTPIVAVGIANQRASTVVWNCTTGKPLGPALGWQDLRTIVDCMTLRAEHGLVFAPNQTATKAAWMFRTYLADATSEERSNVRVGTIDSWIAWNLTDGEHFVTDHTNAAVTGLTTPNGLTWRDDVLSLLGIDRHQLPTIVSSRGTVGPATALPGAPLLTALVGDQQASLIGQGCVTSGRTKVTFGSGGMLDAFVGSTPPSQSTRSSHGTFPIVAHSDDTAVFYGIEAVMLAAGTNIEWLVHDMQLVPDAASTEALAATVASTDGVVFVPAPLGLGTPHWDYGARGTLLGVTRGTTRAHIVRAVLEGVAHRGVDLVEAAEADSGLAIDALHIDGGMSRNRVFVQALADAAQRVVHVAPVTEATTLGAAFLAGTSAGVWGSLNEASTRLTPSWSCEPAGTGGVSRDEWAEAIRRARGWIPDLSALDF